MLNDYMKLREEYTHNLCKANDRELGKFFKKLGLLQNKQCKHEKTHWLQEITKEGEFKDGLFKRCLNCNATLGRIESEPEFVEKLLNDFDKVCEAKELLLSSPVVIKQSETK